MRVINLKNVGPPSVPQEIKRLRREAGDALRRYGQPAVHRHLYSLDDLHSGVAKKCPACYDEVYNQTRNNCPVCFSVGFVSIEDHPTLYISSDGYLTTDETDKKAPLFGGFAEPVLTRVMQPDVAVDVFRVNQQGVLTRVEQSKSYAYWDPNVGDNDLLILVTVANDGYTINGIVDHYQTKQVNNNTIRGWGARAKNQNQFTVSQEFEMALVPPNNVLRQVTPGNVVYGVY